jgi:hypothetical protein
MRGARRQPTEHVFFAHFAKIVAPLGKQLADAAQTAAAAAPFHSARDNLIERFYVEAISVFTIKPRASPKVVHTYMYEVGFL